MKTNCLIYSVVTLALLSGCYDRDIHSVAPVVPEVSDLDYVVDDDTLRVNWSLPSHADPLLVRVTHTEGTAIIENDPTSFNYGVIKVNKPYRFTFKLQDKEGNLSEGQTISFTREGGMSVKDVFARQLDGTKNIQIEWTLPEEKLSKVEVRYDGKEVELSGTATGYLLENAEEKQYTIAVVSFNEEGQSSESVYTDIKVGTTKVAFLGVAANRSGITDDDEKAAADWFFTNYPSGTYLSFADVEAGIDLSQYRVIWWIHDSETSVNLPAESLTPAVLNAIRTYHANGGGLLLNAHAVPYLWEIGRMQTKFNTEFTSGEGFENGDTWSMNVSIGRVHDETTHPVYRGLPWVMQDGKKCIRLIGPGWKENHNVIYKDICDYYQMGNADENAYIKISEENHIRILATWDSINDYWMMANFETLPDAEFQGSAIAIGIGAFEWNQNSGLNPYQENIEKITSNAIEYLKTK